MPTLWMRGRSLRVRVKVFFSGADCVRDHESQRMFGAGVAKHTVRDTAWVRKGLARSHRRHGVITESRLELALDDPSNPDDRMHVRRRGGPRRVLDEVKARLPTGLVRRSSSDDRASNSR